MKHLPVIGACILAIGCGAARAPSAESAAAIERDCTGPGDVESREVHPEWRSCTRRDGRFTGWYDEQGRPTRLEIDRDGDGTADLVETNAYDERGDRIRDDVDVDNDGDVDWIVAHTYDDEHRRIRTDRNLAGDTVRIDYLHDADGRGIGERWDQDIDGRLDYVYRYDEDGERVVVEDHTYDDAGRETIRRDTDRDGVLDACEGADC